MGPDDRFLSILPLNHMFEQSAGLLVPLLSGASVTYAGSLNPRVLVEAMQQARPTLVATVPAVIRLLHKWIVSAVKSQPAWKRWFFAASLGASRAARHLRLPLGSLLFANVRKAFGSKLRFFVSGGAPLDAELARFFLDLTVPVLEGYGLSETSPIVSCNTLTEHVVGSVGRPLPGVEVRIDRSDARWGDAGEVIVRGPNVMAGYFDDPQTTAEALAGGWFRTGDLGRIDASGFLHILGRIKDVIIGESGKNIYPAEIEAEIALSPYVREVCVIGVPAKKAAQSTEEVAVVIAPNEESFADAGNLPRDQVLLAEICQACSRLAGYKRPKFFAIWPGELPRTNTMKMKKHEVKQHLADMQLVPVKGGI